MDGPDVKDVDSSFCWWFLCRFCGVFCIARPRHVNAGSPINAETAQWAWTEWTTIDRSRTNSGSLLIPGLAWLPLQLQWDSMRLRSNEWRRRLSGPLQRRLPLSWSLSSRFWFSSEEWKRLRRKRIFRTMRHRLMQAHHISTLLVLWISLLRRMNYESLTLKLKILELIPMCSF